VVEALFTFFFVFLGGGMGRNEVMGELLFKGSRYSARAGWRLFFYTKFSLL
jgi:hypothetical protein